MGAVAVTVLACVAGLALFAVFRPRARRRFAESVVVQDEAAAIAAAREHVAALTGINVTGWTAFAVPSSDPALLQQAHQLDVFDAVAPLLLRWGLLYGWRVRFCGRHDTVAVGIGGTGSVNFLHVSGRVRSMQSALGRPTPPARLPPAILSGTSACPALDEPSQAGRGDGAGVTQGPAASPESATFVEEGRQARVAVTVESWNDLVLGVTTRASITHEGLGAVLATDRRGRRLQRSAMAGMVVILGAGALVLVMERQAPALVWPLALGAVAFASVVVAEPQMFPRMVVYEFDVRQPLAECRRRHRRQTGLAALVNGGFVAAGLAIGGKLLSMVAAPAPQALPRQLAVGAVVACAWLGLTAAAHLFLARRNRLAAAAELPPAALRRLGYSWREVVGASLQSAVGEEVLYRLVIVSVAWYVTDQPLIGVVVAAALWSATHDVGDVRPRHLRSIELFVLGCALGLVLVVSGLVAAVSAHFLFNLLLLGWPLLSSRSRRLEAAWR